MVDAEKGQEQDPCRSWAVSNGSRGGTGAAMLQPWKAVDYSCHMFHFLTSAWAEVII